MEEEEEKEEERRRSEEMEVRKWRERVGNGSAKWFL